MKTNIWLKVPEIFFSFCRFGLDCELIILTSCTNGYYGIHTKRQQNQNTRNNITAPFALPATDRDDLHWMAVYDCYECGVWKRLNVKFHF